MTDTLSHVLHINRHFIITAAFKRCVAVSRGVTVHPAEYKYYLLTCGLFGLALDGGSVRNSMCRIGLYLCQDQRSTFHHEKFIYLCLSMTKNAEKCSFENFCFLAT